MSELLEEIGAHLVAGGFGELDEDLFLGTLPDSPDAALVVYEYPGAPPIEAMGGGLPKAEMPRFQVVARGVAGDYKTPRALIGEVWRYLAVIVEADLSDVRYLRIQALGSPTRIGRDAEGRELMAANFEAWREVSELSS